MGKKRGYKEIRRERLKRGGRTVTGRSASAAARRAVAAANRRSSSRASRPSPSPSSPPQRQMVDTNMMRLPTQAPTPQQMLPQIPGTDARGFATKGTEGMPRGKQEGVLKTAARSVGLLPPASGTGSITPEGHTRIEAGETLAMPAMAGLGGGGVGQKLTNTYWKQMIAKGKAAGLLAKAANKVATPVGKLTTAKGVATAVQTNSKTRGLVGRIFEKIFTSTNMVTTTDAATGKLRTQIVKTTGGLKPALVVGATLATIAYVVEKSLGGRVFGKFLSQEEAGQATGIAVWMAQDSDSYEEYFAARELQKEAYSSAEGIGEYIPYYNVGKAVDEYVDVAKRAGDIMDKVMLDRMEAEQNNISQADEWKLRDQEKHAMEMEAIATFNAEARITAELQAAARKEDRQDAARHWAKYAAKQRELQAEQMEQIRLFWLQYWEMKMKMQDENRPTTLNFGIL